MLRTKLREAVPCADGVSPSVAGEVRSYSRVGEARQGKSTGYRTRWQPHTHFRAAHSNLQEDAGQGPAEVLSQTKLCKPDSE